MTQPTRTSSSRQPVWHLQVAYHGGNYQGWQIQPNGRTVQAELLMRLRKLFRDDTLKFHATSRTDTGVHALNQHISFLPTNLETSSPRTPEHLCYLLNRWLPPDIRVTAAAMQPEGFHARFSAAAKAYTYVIECGENHSPFSAPFAWQQPLPRNLAAMRQAAACLEGRHDFAGFSANPRREIESTVRHIHRLEVIDGDGRIYLNVIGDGFLYKMVRSLAGYLVEAGQDPHWQPAECRTILNSGQRISKVKTAPPQGLFLARVFFSHNEWLPYQPLLPPFSG